tara:strand:- start:182 stop:562 length:381 start_codon:yes stop_codon:yes gene_type:complete
MKIKITFIVSQYNRNVNFVDPRYLKIFLTDDYGIPYGYMSTKDESETLREISDKYFNTDFYWMQKEIIGFRKIDEKECEVVYLANVPEILGANKSGFFLSGLELKKYKIKMEAYYEELLSRKSRGF